MSLLEDVFLEDEADEAQELERVIEGDEYDDVPRATSPNSDLNSEKEDEAEEDKRRVDPTQSKSTRVVKNPRFILNPARLTGPRGIQVIPEHFKDFKFKGKGHEKEDLDLILKKLEHWAYRLYPKFEFEDCLKKIETLGRKRPVMVHLHKIRNDQLATDDAIVQKDSSDEEDTPPVEDEFDKLLQQQIELAQATPKPSSVKIPAYSTPRHEIIPSIMPKAVSSPSISDEQKERMLRNRKLAEERRLAKHKKCTPNEKLKNISKLDIVNEEPHISQDSSDNERNDNNQAATVEVHVTNIENNTPKERENASHVTEESGTSVSLENNLKDNNDTSDSLENYLKDKSKDINTEVINSDNSVENMDTNNERINDQNFNNDTSSSKCSGEGSVLVTAGKDVDNIISTRNIVSNTDEQSEKSVGEEIMDVEFTEDF